MEHPGGLILSDNVFGFSAGETVAISHQAGIIDSVQRVEPGEVQALTSVGRASVPAIRRPGTAVRSRSRKPYTMAAPLSAEVLDCRSLLVLPGLIDAHVHAIASGMAMLCKDLRDAASLEEVVSAVKAEAAKGGPVVRLGGLDSSRLSPGELQRLDRVFLDNLVSERPLLLKSIEGHSGWFNTPGFAMIGAEAVFTELGLDEDERAAMNLSGRIHGRAYEMLTTPIYDSFSAEERREGMRLVLAEAARQGLAGIHCLEGYGNRRREDFELILELDGGDCDLTLYTRDKDPRLAASLAITRFGGCWCLDGAIGAHSAALGKPYADKPESRGELYFSDEEIGSWIEAGLSCGMQVCVHAIGDRALEQALRVYEGLALQHDLQASRPRVDHFILGSPKLAAQAAALGITSAMQPAFDARWGGAGGGYAKRLGSERALRANPVRGMIESGMRVAGSSDSYITPLDPLGGIRAAMNHHNPLQSVDFDTAVRLFTEDAAYLAHQEDNRGKIARGFQADFTIVQGDRTMKDAQVAKTIKNGRVVFDACRGGSPTHPY
ncbi:amidohydrolase family protein [bacterium]|nr:amidohydrolase family protein [bacterium]